MTSIQTHFKYWGNPLQNLALSEVEGLGDTGNELPLWPDGLQVHDCSTYVRGDAAFLPWVKSQL